MLQMNLITQNELCWELCREVYVEVYREEVCRELSGEVDWEVYGALGDQIRAEFSLSKISRV